MEPHQSRLLTCGQEKAKPQKEQQTTGERGEGDWGLYLFLLIPMGKEGMKAYLERLKSRRKEEKKGGERKCRILNEPPTLEKKKLSAGFFTQFSYHGPNRRGGPKGRKGKKRREVLFILRSLGEGGGNLCRHPQRSAAARREMWERGKKMPEGGPANL